MGTAAKVRSTDVFLHILLLLHLVTSMESGTPHRKRSGNGNGFRADLKSGWRKLFEHSSASHKRFVLLVILVGAALRISQLALPLTYDEAVTCAVYATRSFGFIFSDYTSPANHFLHTALVKCSVAVFGFHRWSLRLPALIAGLLVMPLFYVFVRVMFNRYIALMALSFVAASGALISYSALARGYSLTWLFMMCALLAGRHFAKRNNWVSALMVAVFCAFGMWVVPSMVFVSITVYVWLAFYLVVNYESTLGKRFARLGASFGLFLLLTTLVYAPVVSLHSIDHVLHHPALGENTWVVFASTEQDRTFELWDFFSSTATTWLSALGFVGLVYAAYISVKYRIMLFALVLGAVPLTFVLRYVAPPDVWTYVLFNLHLSSAIGLFYAMKLIQEKVYTGFAKRTRTLVACGLVLVGFGWLGMARTKDLRPRFAEVATAVEWFGGVLKPGDRVYVEQPVDAPFAFELMSHGLDRSLSQTGPAQGGKVYVLVAPANAQTLKSVLGSNNADSFDQKTLVKLKDWTRLEIFAAP
ncbi:MAG: glycosyltransferase family 39 protein [Flavobacteriales bacterium]|nr:glycosyltransferase family 39 protein [Flavobacteriales bacterium]